MISIIKIAFRNVRLGWKRSRKLGISIFAAVFLLLMISAVVNGMQDQMLKGYRNIQTGDLIIMWDSLKNTNHGDTQRFINLYESLSYDNDRKVENEENIKRLSEYIKSDARIKNAFPIIRRNAGIMANGTVDGAVIVYGLTEDDAKQLLEEKVMKVKYGSLYSEDGICISEQKAKTLKLQVGSSVTLLAKTQTGEMNFQTSKVAGIYGGGAFYDTFYAFTSFDNAKRIYKIDDGFFDVTKIFLKDSSEMNMEARSINQVLDQNVMAAETYEEANTFFITMPTVIKLVCVAFTLFLLVLIAIGLRSTIRIQLMQRMREFGTLRAIGFSGMQIYGIIFNETFLISVMAFAAAFAVIAVMLFVIGFQGIYVGEAMSSAFGSEYLFPYLKFRDVIETLGIILLFSLLATLKPGIQLCCQNITDILNKKQNKVHLFKKKIQCDEEG